jgi:RPA family protein
MSDIQRRETAYRLFAAEFDDATLSHQEADEERAPNYVITPTGARVNRLFAVGVLTEVESVNDDVLRGRIVDPTGAFVVYAGQYQPDEMAALEQLDTPAFVAVTGKARTFSPDDSDRVYTSVRPESITQVDAATRDRWVVDTAEQTLERVATYAAAAGLEERGDDLRIALQSRGVPPGLADGIPRATDHYGTTAEYLSRLRGTALDAVRVVTGDRDEATAVAIDPNDEGDGTATWADLLDEDRTAFGSPLGEAEPVEPTSTDEGGDEGMADDETVSTDGEATSEPDAAATESGSTAEPDGSELAASEPEPPAEPETTDEPEPEPETADEETGADDEETGADDETADDSGGIGDFEPGNLGDDDDTDAETADPAGGDSAAASGDAGMYEMDEAEREEVEDEFGTEFSSGNDVADPGEADIDTPDPEETADAEPADAEPAAEPADADPDADEFESGDATEADDDDAAEDEGPAENEEPAEDVDLESHLLDVMAELDDGDGADRAELVDRVASETGASEEAVEDAIQDALIGGQCYEPGDDRLKAI